MIDERASIVPAAPCGPCDVQVPAQVTLAPVEQLLEILAREPATISQAEARRLAEEAPAEKLVALLSHSLDSVVAQAVLILAHRGGEEAVDGLVDLAHRTRLLPIREVAVRTLARCGPRGRARLLELSHRAALVELAIKGLREAASLPSFRPAALARLTELAQDTRLPEELRRDVAVSLVQNGWASGAAVVRELFGRAGAGELAADWERQGFPAHPVDSMGDALGSFVLDFESWIVRESARKDAAREQAAQAWDDRIRSEAREHAAASPGSAASRVGRNDPCPCGSGKKHKKCCGASAGSSEASLSSAVLAFPLGFRGFSVSPFARPAEEQAHISRFMLARDPGQLPDLLPGQPYLAWVAVRRLLFLRAPARAARLCLQILREWGKEPGLDYLEVLGAFAGVVSQFQPALLPEMVELAIRHAPAWGLRDIVAAVGASRQDVGLFLPALVEQRGDDLAALLAWCAAYARFGSRLAGEAHRDHLRTLDGLLARHGETEFVRQARLRLERDLQAPSAAQEGSEEPAGSSPAVNLEVGMTLPAEPLEEPALAPWERECEVRRAALARLGPASG